MTAKDWLNHIASLIAHDRPGNRTHLVGYAPMVQRDIPAEWLTEGTAATIAPDIRNRMQLPDLLALIRAKLGHMPARTGPKTSGKEMPTRDEIWIRLFDNRASEGAVTLQYLGMVRAHGSPEFWAHVLRKHADLVTSLQPEWAQEGAEAAERNWWRERVETIRKHPHPSVRWVRANETLAQVTQPDSERRPWLVNALERIIAVAEAQGADTSLEVAGPRRYPVREEEPAIPTRKVPGQREDAFA